MTDNDHSVEAGKGAAVRDKGEEVLREGRDAAQNILKEGQAKAEEFLDERKSNIAKQVESFAEVSRNAANDLRDRDQAMAADWIDVAANGVEDMANQFRDSDLRGVYDQMSGFARRQPAVFIAGAALLGFAAARFASATAARGADTSFDRQAATTENRSNVDGALGTDGDRPAPQDYSRVDYTRNNGGF